jgi:hypothetical protein
MQAAVATRNTIDARTIATSIVCPTAVSLVDRRAWNEAQS